MKDYTRIFVDGIPVFYGSPCNIPRFYITQDHVSQWFGADKKYLSSSASRLSKSEGSDDWRVRIPGHVGSLFSLKLISVMALAGQHQILDKSVAWSLTSKILKFKESCVQAVKLPENNTEGTRQDLDIMNAETPELPKVSSLFMVTYDRILIEKMIRDNDKRLGVGAVLTWNGDDLIASWEMSSA